MATATYLAAAASPTSAAVMSVVKQCAGLVADLRGIGAPGWVVAQIEARLGSRLQSLLDYLDVEVDRTWWRKSTATAVDAGDFDQLHRVIVYATTPELSA